MTIQMNIGEAKTRLSEMVAASLRGEEVVLARSGQPVARIVPIEEARNDDLDARVARRMAAIGKYRDAFAGYDAEIAPSMTDEEVEARWRRILAPPD